MNFKNKLSEVRNFCVFLRFTAATYSCQNHKKKKKKYGAWRIPLYAMKFFVWRDEELGGRKNGSQK
jgi:hypothetical protein